MEFELKSNRLIFNRELSNLDKLVLRFVKVLGKCKIDYVIVSGYIAILFGRSRNTEDVDLFIEEMPLEKFKVFWAELDSAGFECIQESDPKNAYDDYLNEMCSVRFAVKGTYLPNFELKFPKSDLNKYSLENKIIVELNGETLNTSRMELQIAYKLYLGSDKDIEDAIHLWKEFKTIIDKELFMKFVKRLEVEAKLAELE